jgi:hypothetical protein
VQVTEGEEMIYYYAWRNNVKRETMYGRRFLILCRGTMNSAMVQFENGQIEIMSRNAIRKVKA